MEVLEIFLHDEHGAHRVDDFQETGYQKDDTHQKGGQTAQTLIIRVHGRNGSMVSRTLEKMASGGSISPAGSAQSIRRKCLSRRVCAT